MQQGPHFTPHFILYSRSYCHLCEDMLAALRAFMARAGLQYTVDVIDVDSDPQLTDRFDELVPVLYGGNGATVTTGTITTGTIPTGSSAPTAAAAAAAAAAATATHEICHYFLDEAALQRHLTTVTE